MLVYYWIVDTHHKCRRPETSHAASSLTRYLPEEQNETSGEHADGSNIHVIDIVTMPVARLEIDFGTFIQVTSAQPVFGRIRKLHKGAWKTKTSDVHLHYFIISREKKNEKTDIFCG